MLLGELLDFLHVTVLWIPRFYESTFVLESVFSVDCLIAYPHLASKAGKTWAWRKEGFKHWKSSFMAVIESSDIFGKISGKRQDTQIGRPLDSTRAGRMGARVRVGRGYLGQTGWRSRSPCAGSGHPSHCFHRKSGSWRSASL